MMQNNKSLYSNVKLFIPGGLLPLGDFEKIITVARELEAEAVYFGERQDIILRIPKSNIRYLYNLLGLISFEVEDNYNQYTRHNIVSSYLANSINPNTYWVKDSTYHEIHDSFTNTPSVRVNITDLKQDLVYSFTGDINFVASEEINYWNVYLRTQTKSDLLLFPYLVHSDHISRFVSEYEKLFKQRVSYEEMLSHFQITLKERLVDNVLPPYIRVSEFHNYEGLHAYGSRYWLGIYQRNLRFPIEQLEVIHRLCSMQQIGLVYITPWKSLIVKDIKPENLTEWKVVLAEHDINIGHAQAELNWQVNSFDEKAIALKAKLRSELAKKDVYSSGLIIGVNQSEKHSFSHIIIREKALFNIGKFHFFKRYSVFVRKELNPTFNDFKIFARNIKDKSLVDAIKSLTRLYNKKAYVENSIFDARAQGDPNVEHKKRILPDKYVYQCKCCYTIYDPEIGDTVQNIKPGVSFEMLKEDYICPLCEAPKSSYEIINQSLLEKAESIT